MKSPRLWQWPVSAVFLLLCLGALPGVFARSLFPNEDVYIPELFFASGVHRYAGDWSLQHSRSDRLLFNFLFLPLGRTGDPGLVSLIGRPIAWVAVLGPMWILMRRVGIRSPVLGVSVLFFWIVVFPYTMSQEWVIGAFEAKTFAYGALLLMIICVMNKKTWLAALLVVAAGGMHGIVGLWTLVTFMAASAAARTPKKTLLAAQAAAAAGLAIVLLPAFHATSTPNTERNALNLRIFTKVLWGNHFDPLQFPKVRVLGFALVCLGEIVVVLTHFGSSARDSHDPAWRVLGAAELACAGSVVVGLLATMMDSDRMLLLMPMRIGSVLIPLIALIRCAHLISTRNVLCSYAGDPKTDVRSVVPLLRNTNSASVLIGVALVFAGLLATPLRFPTYRLSLLELPFRAPDITDEDRAQSWARASLPENAVVATDPSFASFAKVERALVAVYRAAPPEDLDEWQERMFALTGIDLGTLNPNDPTMQKRIHRIPQELSDGFNNRPFVEAQMWRQKYGVTEIITRASYPLPVLKKFGLVSVYQLSPVRGTTNFD